MSNIAFRDSSVVIIETSCTTVRAIHGLADLLKTPTVEILARVGLRRSEDGSSTAQSTKPHSCVNEYIVGRQLDDALICGQDIVVSWPFKEGDIKDFYEAEAIWCVRTLLAWFSRQIHFFSKETCTLYAPWTQKNAERVSCSTDIPPYAFSKHV